VVAVSFPLRDQIDAAIATHDQVRYARVTELASSAPESALRLLRETCYRLMGLPEPDQPVTTHILPTTGLGVAAKPAAYVETTIEDDRVTVTRYPAEVQPARAGHLVVPEHHPNPHLASKADVVTTENATLTIPSGQWFDEIMAVRQGIRAAAVLGPGGHCDIVDRRAGRFTVRGPAGHDPAVSASAVYAWLSAGREIPRAITVRVGTTDRLLAVDHA
jgi:hypothetical protein